MKQQLIRLFIFSLSCWTMWGAVAYITHPTDQSGQLNLPIIVLFFCLLFGAILCTTTLLISAYKSTRPHQKLPHLLVKDSLLHGAIVAVWLTGLFVLQLLRVATPLNVVLWIGIFFCVEWFLRLHRQKPGSNIPDRGSRLNT